MATVHTALEQDPINAMTYALRVAMLLWFSSAIFIMWWPAGYFLGLDLTSFCVQGATFGIGALIYVANDAAHQFARHVDSDEGDSAEFDLSWSRCCVRAIATLGALAVLVEVGKWIVPDRHFKLERLVENEAAIIVVCIISYFVTATFLRNHYSARIADRTATRVASSLGAQVAFSSQLRASIQSAFAICVAPNGTPEEKIDRLYGVLNEALAAEAPVHHQATVDRALGKAPRTYVYPLKSIIGRLRNSRQSRAGPTSQTGANAEQSGQYRSGTGSV